MALPLATHNGEQEKKARATMLTNTRKVHADASNFANGVSKQEAYEQVLFMAEGLFHEQPNWVRYGFLMILNLS